MTYLGPMRRMSGPQRRMTALVALAGATASAAFAYTATGSAQASPPATGAAATRRVHHAPADQGGISTPAGNARPAAFDLVSTSVRRVGNRLVFLNRVVGHAGSVRPRPQGSLAGSGVLSYVWPTTLDPSTVGFPRGSGILALAATSHPDFDDTPRYDENRDGHRDNDGAHWHAHWVVLVADATRADGALKVRDIAEGEQPELPKTWPGVPLLLDSPPYATQVLRHAVRIDVPLSAVGGDTTFRYDGVTAALRINADLHDPLLRVENVFDVASGDLSLPGTVVHRHRRP